MGDCVGALSGVWRYPVKSMMGEALGSSIVWERGLLGDRSYALLDGASGKIVSAKNPRKWPTLLRFSAVYTEPPFKAATAPVRITLPNGESVRSDQDDVDQRLSTCLEACVALKSQAPPAAELEEYWPDIENLAHREAVTDEAMPADTFFDCGSVHIISTATLRELAARWPEGRFEIRRFRPNLLIDTDQEGFVENSWVGRTLSIGSEVRLLITGNTSRCVMTTLAQSGLPKDLSILRTAVQNNAGNVGVYASVSRTGTIRDGDRILIE